MNLRDFCKLYAEGLVKIKQYPEKNLAVVKYERKVFYKNLWHLNPLLLEARGAVFDMTTGEVVIHPFTKVFNYNENNTTLDLDTPVAAPRKVNGFMASARWYQGQLLVCTTGSLDSDFTVLAEKYVRQLDIHSMLEHVTYLFEICSPDDPHIVEEEEGAYLIGMRWPNGEMGNEAILDQEALIIKASRPEVHYLTFGQLLDKVAECKHEGFMVRLLDGTTVMKIKSPHYLTKKFLMRMSVAKVNDMFANTDEFIKDMDEEFYPIVRHIVRFWTPEQWAGIPDHGRRSFIESYFVNTQR